MSTNGADEKRAWLLNVGSMVLQNFQQTEVTPEAYVAALIAGDENAVGALRAAFEEPVVTQALETCAALRAEPVTFDLVGSIKEHQTHRAARLLDLLEPFLNRAMLGSVDLDLIHPDLCPPQPVLEEVTRVILCLMQEFGISTVSRRVDAGTDVTQEVAEYLVTFMRNYSVITSAQYKLQPT